MATFRQCAVSLRGAACVAALAGALAPSASANEFQLTYAGSFNTTDALNLEGTPTTDFTALTPFTATAVFDDASPNLAAPVGNAGFVAYSPILATLTVAGQTYNFATTEQNPTAGVSVAIFDGTTGFGPPGHYAAGLLQNPLQDGAGFIGDWASATPTFSAAHLVPTIFTGYTGVGYGSGPDPHNGNPPAVVPIPLTDPSGKSYLLTLGNYDENAGPGLTVNTASLSAVPEATPLALLAAGLGLLVISRRRRA